MVELVRHCRLRYTLTVIIMGVIFSCQGLWMDFGAYSYQGLRIRFMSCRM